MGEDIKHTCFVITKYNDEGRRRYGQLIKPFINDCLKDFNPVLAEAEEKEGEKSINQIHKHIKNKRCLFCIADISEPSDNTYRYHESDLTQIDDCITNGRENVFYEIGYAIGRNKPVLLLKCVTNTKIGQLPFDIRHCSIIGYQDIPIAPAGFNLLLKIWINRNLKQYLEKIKFNKNIPKPSKIWFGSWIKNETKHNIILERITGEEMICTIDIPNYNGNHYCVKEVIVHERQYSVSKAKELMGNDFNGILKKYVGVAFFNVIENHRLDYLLDGFAIHEDLEKKILTTLVWDKPHINEKRMFKLNSITKNNPVYKEIMSI